MKNLCILLAPALVLALAGCQSTGKSASEHDGKKSHQVAEKKSDRKTDKKADEKADKKIDKKVSTLRSAHGASAADRADFIADNDSDGDGKVSKAEFDKTRAAHLTAMDSNRNGAIDEQEYVDEYANRVEKQFSEERAAQVKQTLIRFSSVDANKDKKITAAELHKSGTILFNFLDKKKRGVINRTTPEANTEGTVSRSVLDMPSTHSVAGFLDIYDQDGNGEVTLAEFEADRTAKFSATDSNGDGWLSSEEYLLEFENRLDRQIKQVRSSRIKQAHIRFAALDSDKNADLTLQEFSASGDRIFKGWDTNQDGFVTDTESLPEPKQDKKQDKQQDKKSNSAKSAATNP